MTDNDIFEDAKAAGMTPVYGCKTRHDIESDYCPCDADGKCTQNELVGFKLPIENLAIITKFAELQRDKMKQEPVAYLNINNNYEYSIELIETHSLDAYLEFVRSIGKGQHKLYTTPPDLQAKLDDAHDALKLTQSSLNLAHTGQVLSQIKLNNVK